LAAISNPQVICFWIEIKGDLRNKDRNAVFCKKQKQKQNKTEQKTPLQTKHPK